MAQVYESVTADTSYEAQQIAKERFGNDFTIVNEEVIKNSICFGFGSKQQIKLTVSVNKNAPLQSPKPTTLSHYSTKDETAPYSVTPKPITLSQSMASNMYRKTQQLDRHLVDDMRSLQEGNDEPRSQKVATNNDSLKASSLLDSINQIKANRSKEQSYTKNLKSNNRLDNIESQLASLAALVKAQTEAQGQFLRENPTPILPQGLSAMERQLKDIETPEEIIENLFHEMRTTFTSETFSEYEYTMKAFTEIIQEKIAIASQFTLKKSSKPQVIVLMGPTGVGKTTTIAKLASRYCLDPQKPVKACLLNIDFYKLGAKDQLQKYADIFGIPLEDVTSIASLDYFLNLHKDDDLIIVDTAGRSQYAHKELEELKSYIDRIPNSTKYLAVSSTSKYSDLKAIVNSFDRVGFDNIILTKTDETHTIGPAVGILLKYRKPVAYVTHGQSVPEDYHEASYDFFEERIFGYNNL